MSTHKSVIRPGHNCWRTARCERLAFLVDGAAYYEAFAAAVEQATRQVFIIGWDVHSRTRLRREGGPGLPHDALGELLHDCLQRRPGLEVYVLPWDFAMIYAFEREPVPVFSYNWHADPRFHFHLDGTHPVGASHHQKIAVVDDAVAFCGGMDFSLWRWDTPAHIPNDPRRVDPGGNPYNPVHDVQVMVDGQAARSLAELCRHRWSEATGVSPPSISSASDPWPAHIAADLEGVDVGIARTVPARDDQPPIHETERLYLDAIAAAQHCLYLENQYFTSNSIGQALASRLDERNGPEVVIVLPRECPGWLEETTMGVLRARLLRRLRAADRHGRLRVYHPDVTGLSAKQQIVVHSKVLVVDDRLLRIGSSNTSNRSMGLDTECDLVIEANDPQVTAGIAALRNRLLGEHLGTATHRVAEVLTARGSLIDTIEVLNGGERALRPLDGEVSAALDRIVPDAAILDPEKPMEPERLLERFVPPDVGRPAKHGLARILLVVLAMVALAAAWRFTPLGEWLDVRTLAGWGTALRDHPLGPLAAIAGFLVGSFLMVPVTLLIAATALAFGPLAGFAYALTGSVIAALANYTVGNHLGRRTLREWGGSRLNELSRRLARRGLTTVIALRLVPVAPFTLVNIAAGASHIRFRDFALGTLIGMVPGTAGLTVFTDQLVQVITKPDPTSIATLAGVTVVLIAAVFIVRRLIGRRERRSRDNDDAPQETAGG